MSTDAQNPGGKLATAAEVDAVKATFEQAAAEEQQLELVEPLTADEIDEARERLGGGAGMVAIMRDARAKRGRPKGSRNRRTDDFEKYIRQFGQDPAITLMQIHSTTPEELVARSAMLDPEKRRMTYTDAQGLRARCAEALMPYLHGKVPVKVDATIRGVMVVEEFGNAPLAGTLIDQEPIGILPLDGELGA